MDSIAAKDLLTQALLEIRRLKKKVAALEKSQQEPIAIVGMGCRLPQNITAYDGSLWRFLSLGLNAITEVPQARWPVDDYYHSDPSQKGCSYTRYGAFIENIADFDAQFFGISPREAICVDPQQRLMLEVAWEALEDAAIAPCSLRGTKVGVFLAQCSDDYSQLVNTLENRETLDYYSGTGVSRSMLAGRLSYLLGTHGPTLQLDTACSSALVAAHLACQSLRLRESELAIIGGVHLNLSPLSSILRSRVQALSPDGKCKAFAADANGFVQGEGAGVLILKRLSDAEENNDRILAVIRGSAINHDGASAGLTAPSESAQVAVLQQALDNAGVLPSEINYIEAHGTGTSLGDPIEINALNSIYGAVPRKSPLWIGSVKSNFGHLEAAAGILSVMKAILAIQHQTIPLQLHVNQPNPLISWASIPFQVPTQTIPWQAETSLRTCGVSSFGMSGTNGHIIIQEIDKIKSETPSEDFSLKHILLLSAKSSEALVALVSRYLSYLKNSSALLADICYTAAIGRNHFNHRVAFVCSSYTELKNALASFLQNQATPYSGVIINPKVARKVIFSFEEKPLMPNNELLITLKNKYPILENLILQYENEVSDPQNNALQKDVALTIHLTNIIDGSLDLVELLVQAYLLGIPIEWKQFYAGKMCSKIQLPPYPFQHKRYFAKAAYMGAVPNVEAGAI